MYMEKAKFRKWGPVINIFKGKSRNKYLMWNEIKIGQKNSNAKKLLINLEDNVQHKRN